MCTSILESFSQNLHSCSWRAVCCGCPLSTCMKAGRWVIARAIKHGTRDAVIFTIGDGSDGPSLSNAFISFRK